MSDASANTKASCCFAAYASRFDMMKKRCTFEWHAVCFLSISLTSARTCPQDQLLYCTWQVHAQVFSIMGTSLEIYFLGFLSPCTCCLIHLARVSYPLFAMLLHLSWCGRAMEVKMKSPNQPEMRRLGFLKQLCGKTTADTNALACAVETVGFAPDV